ncbi:MAG: hypothetical protein A2Z14_12395 [Chloroflexi bacterium RBG_16_48_8]|nr:MAG: hypothetical protein A2Z14_12395 [Chloroflexi bacterium RBG_16_48_8]
MVKRVGPSNNVPEGIVVCVGGVVLEEGRILLVRQARGHPLEKQWTIPWGLINPGEAPEAAILREIEEEAGVEAEIEGLLGIQNLPDPWEGWIGIVFQCQHVSGIPKPDGEKETDRAGYFFLNEIASLEGEIEVWCKWLARRVLIERKPFISSEPNNPYEPKLAFL